MTDDIPRIDWPAIRAMVRSDAYYRKASADIRGESDEERAARMALSRATSAGVAAHGDRHCPGCGRPQADTSKCRACRDKHRQYMEGWRKERRERRD